MLPINLAVSRSDSVPDELRRLGKRATTRRWRIGLAFFLLAMAGMALFIHQQ